MIILAIIIILVTSRIAKQKKKRKKAKAKTIAVKSPQIVDFQKEREKEAKRLERAEREAERERAREEKQLQRVAQAEQDIPFYEIQMERLTETAEAIRNQYKIACDSVNHDSEMNRHGTVINGKIVDKHISERDRLLKKLITAENQIYNLEKKIRTAEVVLMRA